MSFYEDLPTLQSFPSLADDAAYTPLPDGWLLGIADIVRSTLAVEGGRYKAVNTAAAAVIAAVSNGMRGREFPFSFSGDGASFALPLECADIARHALAEVAAWARDDLHLDMRVALVPVDLVREKGVDVRIARFSPAPGVVYAMFAGGGLAYAEKGMKNGEFALDPALVGTRPDLTGLSCRFADIRAERGLILSMIVVPLPGADRKRFGQLMETVLEMVEASSEGGRPIPSGGPPLKWPPAGLGLEVLARRRAGASLAAARVSLLVRTLFSHLLFRTGLPVGSFEPRRYLREIVVNTDFRKFGDGLMMTLDCTLELADDLEALLEEARRDGVAAFGLHRQNSALLTCFVPSASRSDHVHFVDGAEGGYVAAARMIKAK